MGWKKLSVIGPETWVNEYGQLRELVSPHLGHMPVFREVKPVVSCGRPCLTRRENGAQKNYALHILVANEFIPGKPKNAVLVFKNGNIWDCRAENLEWRKRVYRVSGPGSRISTESRTYIIDQLARGATVTKIAHYSGTSVRTVYYIKKSLNA